MARTLLFTPTAIEATAGAPLTIVMDNQEYLVPHDIALPGYGKVDPCPGPCAPRFTITAPPRGLYTFICSLHPEMTVRLTTR